MKALNLHKTCTKHSELRATYSQLKGKDGKISKLQNMIAKRRETSGKIEEKRENLRSSYTEHSKMRGKDHKIEENTENWQEHVAKWKENAKTKKK